MGVKKGVALLVVSMLAAAFSLASPRAVDANVADTGRDFVVQPVYIYPADQHLHPEYVSAIRSLAHEVRGWYHAQVGRNFRLASLRIVKAPDDYLHMRCGPDPAPSCAAERQDLPYLLSSVYAALGGFRPHQSTWIFAQGGGGWAGANLYGDYIGFAMVGDWTLEPISGVAEPAGIPCSFATWQCTGGVPKGAAAHELGHTFGLHHPPPELPGQSLMRWHGDYPDTQLLPHERMILERSPMFLGKHAFDAAAPWLNFENDDVMQWGRSLIVHGHNLAAGDTLEFRDATRSVRVTPQVLNEFEMLATVPSGLAPGYIRAWHGDQAGNVVPVNFSP